MSLTVLLTISLISAPILYLLAKVNKNFAYTVYALIQLFAFSAIFFNWIYIPEHSGLRIFSNLELTFNASILNRFFASVTMLIISMTAVFMLSIKKKKEMKLMLLSLVSTGVIGSMLSNDFLTLLIFWELTTWSSLIMIVLDKKIAWKEALKYVAVGSIGTYSMMYAVFLLYNRFGTLIYTDVANELMKTSGGFQLLIFILLAVMAFAKAGSFPLHIWLRGAHSSAPDEFSSILSGALTKMGAFLMFIVVAVLPSTKFFAWMPEVQGIPLPNYILALLSGISIIVGTVMAIRMEDAKQLIAFSTVSNSGYILMALAIGGPYATAGGLMHVLNHALASSAMFLAIAAVAHRTGTTKMHEMGGLIFRMPFTFTAYLVAIISIAGIPPMSGFASKWLIYQQLVRNGLPFLAFMAFFGSIGSFMYVFKPLAGIFLGQLKPQHKNIKEAPIPMLVSMMVLTLLTIFWGILPSNAISFTNKISEQVGIATIKTTFSEIFASTGKWDSIIVVTVFTIGFVIAFVISALAKKPKKVDLMDTYTGGEFIYTAELYHFSYKMYRSFDRMFERWPLMEKWLENTSYKLRELGAFFRSLFYPSSPQGYVTLSILAILTAYWWLR
ncbi:MULTISPECIES: proton-conducting transporter membrane subunit [Kosmotoga]|uniref:NADH/Ubiquinone/plastoquinone (Complex I) n=1 Tax=Kosmotoga olearia (strain ATCC BAA-1733 / DSM 21960 / TBF 19.5.1) TaxID=521045 RepID=C5CHQ8_KOSOT|nr:MULTISPECIES: proton-conducting transporter membrane subunit [Kosmotoga]ACR80734.1 NADH/Ubiquinone/plastoquinone (complex I) [Kosmotoga olearia TBF 19.5.1]OAA19180.1 NADH dehydrogenase [Kosmotoga sp. DU53]